ncbi:flagellar motor switch phosphatase FliY [uncultured Clostridium sp.]|jgi:flagellar motor switch protein FliN/FliY|uniref:flagellar motor switch phosphatase FliY n=1 Tax=uncultured Clostridium sp. TaxID=59620 RepID=UPI00262EC399|nr:flagellar motor switch phosphatase FliY [uncultured Clostridium sp.]
MADGFLSQEEIDALLNGDSSSNDNDGQKEPLFSEQDNDLLGEIGNISMGSASTALSQVINQSVNITTPVVSLTTIGELKRQFAVPNILLEVQYTSGIVGKNILIMKIPDAAVIANLMMGGDGSAISTELSEIEISAVQEAMNQMIGSAATSMATMFAREVNISPPKSKIWENLTETISTGFDDEQEIVNISFNLKIGELVDSTIMQVLPLETGKKIIKIMMGEDDETKTPEPMIEEKTIDMVKPEQRQATVQIPYVEEIDYKPIEVSKAQFESLDQNKQGASYNNMDLILDVPLDVSVVLGKTKKSIKDVLALGVGSVIELDKLADEPLEILVNGKRIAYGEVVVIDESFGIRITNIIDGSERIKSLK